MKETRLYYRRLNNNAIAELKLIHKGGYSISKLNYVLLKYLKKTFPTFTKK